MGTISNDFILVAFMPAEGVFLDSTINRYKDKKDPLINI